VRRRRVDVVHASAATPEAALRAAPLFGAPTVDLAAALRRGATPAGAPGRLPPSRSFPRVVDNQPLADLQIR